MSYKFTILQIVLISGLILFSEWGKSQKVKSEEAPIDYAKLELNKDKLRGSRWAIENRRKITVYHAFQIVDMVKVDTTDMSIRVDFHMRQRWEASGLDIPEGLFNKSDPADLFISAEESVLDSVWSPDSFIPNARATKIMSIATTQSVVNIFQNKTIIYKARMYAVLGCSFTFQWYPLDIQTCDMSFESYKYTSSAVEYVWEPYNPVTHVDGILLYQYDFELPPKLCSGNQKRWGGILEYPYVKMTFKFERKLGNNVIQIFIPTILVVILSFFSFWLGLDAVPGRISLLVTCMLTLVTMHGSLKGVIPPVHYIKILDVWMIGCMVFVFGAICEFIVIKYLKWRADHMQKAKNEQEKYLKNNSLHQNFFPPGVPKNQIDPFSVSQLGQKRQAWENAQIQKIRARPELNNMHHPGMPGGYPDFINMAIYNQQFANPPKPLRPIWVKIDRVCRILFPLLFACFNAGFWPVLLVGSAKQHQDI